EGMNKDAKAVMTHHEETKHHFRRYARSPGYMDWQNQPIPFRTYEGAEPVSLELLKEDPVGKHPDLYRREHHSSSPVSKGSIGAFLELSMGLSAWKAAGPSRWALRMNPSSGNLHPTEAHLVIPQAKDLSPGVYHYNPYPHALERRAVLPESLCDMIRNHFGAEVFLVGLSSIFWREAWKYGERAFRYCNHDVGHALAALAVSANLQGWKLSCLHRLSDADVNRILGFDRTEWKPLEAEHPDLICVVHPANTETASDLPRAVLSAFSELDFQGTPNRLSRDPVDWQAIQRAAEATEKPRTDEKRPAFEEGAFAQGAESALSAAEIIRRRRSAVSFSGKGMLARACFLSMLKRTLPRHNCPPFDLGLGPPRVNLLLFVHRVEEMKPGLYFFHRTGNGLDRIRQHTRSDFGWEPVQGNRRLFLLEAGNFQDTAVALSCHQGIAGYSAFSLGMIADFQETIAEAPYKYRHLFWETGMIGQVLYLEAEAYGVRGTGIGCFFDDPVHELLGLKDSTFQSLYHFTVGDPVEDERLSTYPPYHHLKR
ncbi:MAG: SagB/ThcOx family dehydrogenase, partial [Thermodesulfobacteriota bacterium]